MAILKAGCFVAHPDDCVIFAWPFMSSFPNFDWEIIYLTYTADHPRAQELTAYWDKRGITTHYLGCNDSWESVIAGQLGFDQQHAHHELLMAANRYDLILTHNSDGEYGHLHHEYVHRVLCKVSVPKVYFDFNDSSVYSKEYTARVPVATEELPLHRAVVEGVAKRNTLRYNVPPDVEKLINEYNENINIR